MWGNRRPPFAEDSPRSRLRVLLPLTPLAAVLAAATLAGVLAQTAVATVIYVVMAVAAAGMLGWRAGESRRDALQREIDDRYERAANAR